MKKFISYILKMYIWSVIIIALASFLEVAIEHHFSPPIEDTPFSSPAFAALMCGVLYPAHNLWTYYYCHLMYAIRKVQSNDCKEKFLNTRS